MNIFHLDTAPDISARMLCDKHIPKMLLETCQMLSTSVRNRIQNLADDVFPVYKSAYPKHPMTIWVNKSWGNFRWTMNHGKEINRQYQYRFGKIHKSERVLDVVQSLSNALQKSFGKDMAFTEPPRCMPDTYKWCDHYTESYREYYFHDKQYFAKWEKGMRKPQWFKNMEAKHGCQ